MSESDFEKNIDDIMKISQDIINKQKEEARKLKEKEKEEARKLREKEEEEARKLREKEEEEARKQKIEREKKEQKEKEIKEWESGEAAKSVERYTELLAKGYKITASSCGGDTASLDVLKFAIEKGLKEEDINYLFTNTKNPERMEVLVKQGHADVNSYPIQNIKDWYEESYTTEKVYLGCRWETHYSGKYDKEWEECVEIYDYVKHYKNPEAIMAFQKLVELGYKPKNVEDAEAVVYMIEVSEKEKEQQAKMEAEKQAEIQRKAEEEQAKILREKEEKASDTLEIDKLPPALKLLGKTLLEKDLNRYVPRPKHDSDGNKTKCIFDYLTVRGYKKEESDKVWLYNVEEIATELV
ncbi:MAG: hypothetical protein J6T72_00125 [Alphaproteobacteria bacterium]|nr:hypothetical protein [Alphaproteobacteria bacterium]